jgi:uncharacterized membrane protein
MTIATKGEKMGEKMFSKKEAIKFGWETMKANIGFFIGLLAFVMVLYAIPSIISEATKQNLRFISILAQIIQGILQILISMGLLKVALAFCRNEKPTFGVLFSCCNITYFWKFFVSSLVYGLITLGGTLLLIVPGVIWGIQFQYFRYFIVDKELGPIEALKKSSQITKGTKGNLFLLSLLFGLINIAGLIALLVGLFASIPVTMIADAFVYRILVKRIEGTNGPQATGTVTSAPGL